MSETQNKYGYLKKKLFFQGIIMVGLVGTFWFIGEILADLIIGFEISWLRVSSVSGLVVCVGIIISAATIDWLTDRVYNKFLSGKN